MINGTHNILIMVPADDRLDYINRKGWTSIIILQAIVAEIYNYYYSYSYYYCLLKDNIMIKV